MITRQSIRAMDIQLGRKLFSNNAGITGNIAGPLALLKEQKRDRSPLDTGNYTDIPLDDRAIVEEGVVDSNLDRVQERFDQVMEDDSLGSVYTYNGTPHLKRVSCSNVSFQEYFPEAAGLISDGLKQVLRSYYGTYCKPVDIVAKRNMHRPPRDKWDREAFKDYRAASWHLDPMTTDLVRVFIFVRDVTDSKGPTGWVSRTDLKQLLKRHDFQDKTVHRPGGSIEQEAEVNTTTGPAGSIAALNPSKILHRVGNPAPGKQRDVIQLTFAPSNEPLPDNWLEQEERYLRPEAPCYGFSRLFAF